MSKIASSHVGPFKVEITYENRHGKPSLCGELKLNVPSRFPIIGGSGMKIAKFCIDPEDIRAGIDFHYSTPPPMQYGSVDVEAGGSVELQINKAEIEFSLWAKVEGMLPNPDNPYGRGIEVPTMDVSHSWPVKYLPHPLRSETPEWADKARIDFKELKQKLETAALQRIDNHVTELPKELEDFLKFLLMLGGGERLMGDMVQGAQSFAQSLAPKSPTPVAGEVPKDILGVPSILLAKGFSGSLGGAGGGSVGAGLYVTNYGQFGVFGGAGLDFGVLFSLSVAEDYFLFWETNAGSALHNFKGEGIAVGVDIDLVAVPVSLGLSIFFNKGDPIPIGISVRGGVGEGFPVNVFASDSKTWTAGTQYMPNSDDLSNLGKAKIHYHDVIRIARDGTNAMLRTRGDRVICEVVPDDEITDADRWIPIRKDHKNKEHAVYAKEHLFLKNKATGHYLGLVDGPHGEKNEAIGATQDSETAFTFHHISKSVKDDGISSRVSVKIQFTRSHGGHHFRLESHGQNKEKSEWPVTMVRRNDDQIPDQNETWTLLRFDEDN